QRQNDVACRLLRQPANVVTLPETRSATPATLDLGPFGSKFLQISHANAIRPPTCIWRGNLFLSFRHRRVVAASFIYISCELCVSELAENAFVKFLFIF